MSANLLNTHSENPYTWQTSETVVSCLVTGGVVAAFAVGLIAITGVYFQTLGRVGGYGLIGTGAAMGACTVGYILENHFDYLNHEKEIFFMNLEKQGKELDPQLLEANKDKLYWLYSKMHQQPFQEQAALVRTSENIVFILRKKDDHSVLETHDENNFRFIGDILIVNPLSPFAFEELKGALEHERGLLEPQGSPILLTSYIHRKSFSLVEDEHGKRCAWYGASPEEELPFACFMSLE